MPSSLRHSRRRSHHDGTRVFSHRLAPLLVLIATLLLPYPGHGWLTQSVVSRRQGNNGRWWLLPQRQRPFHSATTILLFSSSSRHQKPQQGNQDNAASSPTPKHRYLATCIPGLSTLLAQEVHDILQSDGSEPPPDVQTLGHAAVQFAATTRGALQCLIHARVPHKLMEWLCETTDADDVVETRHDLYRWIYDNDAVPVAWLLGNGRGGLLTLSVSAQLHRDLPDDLNHSHFTALTIKNALCDAVRDQRGDRPNVDTVNPDVPLVAVLQGQPGGRGGGAHVSLYRQLHVGSLHRRGYHGGGAVRHKAALKESLAAGLLYAAQWHHRCQEQQEEKTDDEPLVLVDPMAGSGTLVLEALFMAANVAPHLVRLSCCDDDGDDNEALQFPPITRWKHANDDLDDGIDDISALWKQLLQDASQRAKVGMQWLRGRGRPIHFVANDVHPGALKLLDQAVERAGVSDLVQVHCSDCQEWVLPTELADASASWTVVCNPPWGLRLGDDEDANEAWRSLGVFLRHACPAGRTVAHVLSGQAEATRHLRLRKSASVPLQVGNVKLRWITYPLLQQPPSSHRWKEEEENDDDDDDDDMEPYNENSRQRRQSSPRRRSNNNKAQAHDNRQQRGRRHGPTRHDSKKKPQKKRQTGVADRNEWLLE